MKTLVLSPLTRNSVITVANLMQDGVTLASDSNVPGDDINLQERTLCSLGTDVTSTILKPLSEGPDTEEMSGTSMAAPHVSGIAAVVLSNYPQLTGMELATCLLESATPIIMTDEGRPVALTSITTGELNQRLKRGSMGIVVDKIKITPKIWAHSQRLYGQGRANLENALRWAKEHTHTDLT